MIINENQGIDEIIPSSLRQYLLQRAHFCIFPFASTLVAHQVSPSQGSPPFIEFGALEDGAHPEYVMPLYSKGNLQSRGQS